jgi:aspartate aminotransferase
MVLGMLNEIPGVITNVPTGAFYIFPDISAYFGKSDGKRTVHTANDLCMYILEEANVSLVTGEAFRADNCVRISYAASEAELREAMKRIKEVLAKLN